MTVGGQPAFSAKAEGATGRGRMFNTTLRWDATLADLTGDGTTCLLFRPAGMIPHKTTLDELRIDRSSSPRGRPRGWLVLMVLLLVGAVAIVVWWMNRP